MSVAELSGATDPAVGLPVAPRPWISVGLGGQRACAARRPFGSTAALVVALWRPAEVLGSVAVSGRLAALFRAFVNVADETLVGTSPEPLLALPLPRLASATRRIFSPVL